MTLISAYVDQNDLGGGVFQNTIAMKPIGVYQSGSLLPMVTDWQDGDATTPQIVTRAPLRVRGANDGMRRFYPVNGDDTKYLELGAPFIQVAGNWTQVARGVPTRTAHRLSWQTANADFNVWHGGHFCKLEIELKNGFVPQNSRVAFPVGIQGLSRSGTAILDGATVVANLRPFVMYDAANERDIRTITHQFTTLNGNPYLLLTLPSLTGMSRPVIDPTLSLQPDATTGLDTYISSLTPTTNYGTDTRIWIGQSSTETDRTLIKFDLSSLPTNALISSAILSLFATNDASTNARTYRVFRQSRDWIEAQATWNIWKTSNNWATAGGFGAADCEQTDIGSRAFTATETLSVFKDFSLTPTTKAALDFGNGWMIKADTESGDEYGFSSSDNATAANRPKLVVVYSLPSSLGHSVSSGVGSGVLSGVA